MNNGSLYREEGIVFNLNWIYQYNKEISEHEHGDYEISDKQPITSNDSEDENFEEGENLSEDEAEMPAGKVNPF